MGTRTRVMAYAAFGMRRAPALVLVLCALSLATGSVPVAAQVEVIRGTDVHEPGKKPVSKSLDALTRLASCLAHSGVLFYGASWYPQCRNQFALFGAGASSLPYVEFSPDGTRDMTARCETQDIEAYPTWDFPGGVRREGVLPPSYLATLSGCEYRE